MSSSRHRVPAHTPAEVNRRIQQEITANVHFYEQNPTLIRWRLQELDREWDIERAIQANAGALGFLGSLLSTRNRRWLLLPLLVTGFLFQHAIQGWCPPVPILRRLGFRTSHEIEQERQALKALRGDFAKVSRERDKPAAALRAAKAS